MRSFSLTASEGCVGLAKCCWLPSLFCLYSSICCCAAYYRGAMGILLVYDVTDEASFNNIRNWMRNIEQHASDNVNKVCMTE